MDLRLDTKRNSCILSAMITSLTPQQIAKFPEYVKEWKRKKEWPKIVRS